MMEKYVGKNLPRPESVDKALGKALYAGDVYMENMLHLALVRSTSAHADIVNVDFSSVPEDAFIFTAKDLKENKIADIITHQPVFADKKVRFMGEPIALIAAETEEKARKYASLVKVTYNEKPVYLDAEKAMHEGSEPIHEEGNVFSVFKNEKGDAEKAFSECDLVVEDMFDVPAQEHAYIEPEAGIAWMEDDGLHMMTASQNVFLDRSLVCLALGLDAGKVHVKAAVIGGAFGGKDGHSTQIFTALAAYKTGRPCRLVFSRNESIECSFKRHPIRTYAKMGFSRDGRILAFKARGIVDTGAYIGYGASVLGLYSEHLPGPYFIPNVSLESHLVFTNKVSSSAFRGFGAPQANFATESLMTRAAEALGMDEIDIRRLNSIRTGETVNVGTVLEHSAGLDRALDIMKETPLYKESLTNTDKTVGYGLSAGMMSCGFGKKVPDSAEVEIAETEDGAEVRVGFTDMGQGSTNSLRAIACDALSLPPEKVVMVMSDTDKTFDCGCAAASRSSFIGGNAILAAAEKFNKLKSEGGKNVTVREKVTFPESSGDIGKIGVPHAMYTYIVQLAKVKMDMRSGCVQVVDFIDVTEAGKIINPVQFAGQSQGGAVQSIGLALTEGCAYAENGKMTNGNFTFYNIPTALDAPNMSVLTVDGFEPSGPFGVKGGAEAPTVPALAAVSNAVHKITGRNVTTLPISAEENLSAMKARMEK